MDIKGYLKSVFIGMRGIMVIKNSQLEIWSHQGATATPKALREKIESVLRGDNSKITNRNAVGIYLQGSYRNSTNIFGNSDVDIVVQTNNVFYSDTSNLSLVEKEIYESQRISSQYTWSMYKREVLDTLIRHFGIDNVEIGNKSIKINTGSYEADIIPCIHYKKFINYGYLETDKEYIEGIKFFTTTENREVINYPKRHYLNGVKKNQQTEEMYKKTVRIFKNIKSKLVTLNKINGKTAPSYFVENLLYNVPNDNFIKNNYGMTVYNLLKWLSDNRSNLLQFLCQNEMIYLFGATPEQWNENDAKNFIDQSINLWNEWDK
jgi:hypothetical protein